MKYFTHKVFLILLLLSHWGDISGQKTDSISIPNNNQTIIVKLEKEVENLSEFDKYFNYFKDLIGPIIAIVGLFITLPILRRKLLENHISKALIDIQDANKRLLLDTTDLIDEFTPQIFSNEIVSQKELEDIFDKVKLLFKKSQEGGSDSQTILFLLKQTIQNTIKHYPSEEHEILITRDIYGLVLFCLEYVVFFSTQVVQVPKSTKINKEHLISEGLKKYVTHSEFLKYKHFNQGIIYDPNSAHYLLFYSKINDCTNTLLKRGAFEVFGSTSAIKKILYAAEIYAPLELTAPNKTPLGSKKHTLHLIGFKRYTSLQSTNQQRHQSIYLIYCNTNSTERFVSNLKFASLITNFKDAFIEDSDFQLNKATMTQNNIETFTLKYESEYLESLFVKNKSKFKNKLK